MASSGHPIPDSVPATLTRGAAIGRYIVLALVGRGGMGEVYAAYDPELDRKVAVKLLRVKPGNGVSLAEGRHRTLREAQAIARLSHANVVVVYDVGTFEDKVFIAMEYVEGNTVTYWLQARQRSWQEILKVFMAAGSGLAAAHEKGLVHRDFKTDNVMIDRAGQVRVMDFGLARQAEKSGTGDAAAVARPTPAFALKIVSSTIRAQQQTEDSDTKTLTLRPESEAAPRPLEGPSSSGMFEARLTRTGAMMGTPAYMAPEQFLGTPTDARSDQFSFCIALYEALYGERPFEGNTMSSLTANVVQGNVRDAPANSKVPPWLRRVLLRGLKPRAKDRWASMEELIAALGKNPTVSRRRWALAIGGATMLIGAIAGGRQLVVDRRPICGGGPDKLAGIWDLPQQGAPLPLRHEQIRKAFQQTSKSYAPDVFVTVSRALTGYARRWVETYKDACEATHVRGEQSAEVLDLRMSCLQERLGGLGALTDVFSTASGEVVDNAVNAANALGSLDRCSDVPLLRAVVRPPEDPGTRARVGELRNRLANLKASFDSGRWKATLNDFPNLTADTRALGYQPLVAETLYLTGLMLAKTSDAPAAEKAMVEAFWLADASRHDEVRAQAATNLIFVVGYGQGRFAEAYKWAQAANTVLQRLGGHELLHAWLLNDLGCVYHLEGQKEAALRALEESLALKEKALGRDHPDVGLSEANIGLFYQALGKGQEALAHLDRSITLLESSLGRGHPDLAVSLSNRGETLNALGRYREARTSFERAAIIWERELGSDNVNLGYALTGIGMSYLEENNPASALVPLERAFRVRVTQETESSRRAETAFALAKALWGANRDRARAMTLAERAADDFRKAKALLKVDEVNRWRASSARPTAVAQRPRARN
jgi:eukaryotic-like serine/threonine-protein kinase